jgi:hypothetical protein
MLDVPAAPQPVPLVHSVAETAKILRLSVAMIYLLFDSGELRRS